MRNEHNPFITRLFQPARLHHRVICPWHHRQWFEQAFSYHSLERSNQPFAAGS